MDLDLFKIPPILKPHLRSEALDAAVRDLRVPDRGQPLAPEAARELACMIAWRGVGKVAPNPLVGAVIVDRDGRFLAAGAHERVGGPHAEINALAGLDRASLEGATLYVTLEPCSHVGRTPACAPVVAASGIKKVVIGTGDPNRQVAGQGLAGLVGAGVMAAIDDGWTAACERLAEFFLWNMRRQSPFVGLKVATDLHGAMARRGDRRAFITGPRARAHGHFLRTCYDAIMVGAGTVIADDPVLDTRDALVAGRSPRRVVIDPRGRALKARPASGWRLLSHAPDRVIWIHADSQPVDAELRDRQRELRDLGATVIHLPTETGGGLGADGILEALWGLGVTSVLLEGGAGLYAPFLRAKAVNRLHRYLAPVTLDGDQLIPWSPEAGALTPAGASAIDLTDLSPDLLLEADLPRKGAAP